MKIFKILKNKGYLVLFIIATLAMLMIYPTIQVYASGGLQNLDLWLDVIPPINLALVIIFSILFGLLLTLQIYNFRDRTCSVGKKVEGASSGGIGAVLAVFVPACPACLSLASLFLPAATAISVNTFFVKFSTLLLLISIIFMLLGMFLLGGFKKS